MYRKKIERMSRAEFASRLKKEPEKYVRGDAPCGNCNLGLHVNCRPRLSDEPCTCSCERAVVIREELKIRVSNSPTEIYKELYQPGLQKHKKSVDKN